MLDLRRLLKFSPTEAIIMLANYGMGTQLRPEICEVGQPVSLDHTLTQVSIKTLPVYPEMIQNPYTGESVFTYNRYDLEEIFEQIVASIKPPTTVRNLLDMLQQNTGIVFDANDFNDETITTDTFVLKAAETSKRWVGEVGVVLLPSLETIHISQWLSTHDHGGLTVRQRVNIWDVFPNNILNGFTVGLPPIDVYLSTTNHGGLQPRTKPLIHIYLTAQDHGGLSSNTKPTLGVYLPGADHSDLVAPELPRVNVYLPVENHSGLTSPVSPNITAYLEAEKHDGLQVL